MVESTSLLTRQGLKTLDGSNPSVSANKFMKTFKSVLILIVVLSLSVAVLGATKTKKDADFLSKDLEIDLSPEIKSEQLCYIWNTEAGDKAMLSVDIRDDKAIGEFYWLPFEKDSKTGIFKGNLSQSGEVSRVINGIWETKAEGMTANEEIKIILEENIAKVGFGEMKDRGDGVYVYANTDDLSYEPNLQRTDCGDEAMD